MTDPTRDPAYRLVAIDASSGDWYDLGNDAADQVAVWTQGRGGLPASERAPRLDPSSWRLHDMQELTPGGNEDLRLAVQSFNDWEGPYADAPTGAAPAQAEHFTAANRSTREVDASGRTALPGSQRRIVGSEDGRYALALALTHLPMDPIASEEGDSGGTRTRADAAKDRHRVPPGVEFGEQGDGVVTAAGAVAGRRNRPLGYIADEWGEAAQLGAVLTASLGPGLYNGREGQPIRLGAIRADAHFATAGPTVPGAASPGLTGPILFDARDASAIPENDPGPDAEADFAAIEAQGGSAIRPRPVKGRMWHDRSWAGLGASPNELGQTGKWVPVLFVMDEDVNIGPRKPPPPPPPKKPPPPQPPPEEEDDDEEEDEPEPETGPGVDPRFLDNFVPVPGTDLSEGGIGQVGGQGDPVEEDGTGRVGDDGQPVEDGPQARNFEGEGVPCPATATGFVDSDGELLDPDEITDKIGGIINEGLGALTTGGFSPVTNTDGDVQVEDRVYSTHPGGGPDQEQSFGGTSGPSFLRRFLQQVTQKTVATAPMPGPGQPGSPTTLTGYLDSMASRVSAHAAVIDGAFGGPGFLAGNIGVQHVNTPGNPPTPSRIGARWSASPGEHLVVGQSAVEHVQVLIAPDGASVFATGPGVQRVARDLRGSVRDVRSLVQLDNGGAEGDLIASSDLRFRVDADSQLMAGQGTLLIDQRYPRPTQALQIGYFNPATGGMLGAPTWGVTPDGVSFVQDLADVPDPPPDGLNAIYSRDGQFYMQSAAGVETALGVGGGGLIVRTEDNSVTGTPTSLKFTDGTLTNNGDGSFSVDITGGGLSSPVAIADGGTGSTTAANARTALGLAIGTNVQAWDQQLQDLAGLAPTKGRLIAGDGTNWVALSVGTDGQTLIADSGETAGFKWDTPGASGLGDPVEIAHGGTEATTAADARTNLGVAIGSDVQAWNQSLDDISGLILAPDRAIYINGAGDWTIGTHGAALDDFYGLSGTDTRFMVRSGASWAAQTPANARTDMGLGTIATQAASNVSISGGSISGITDLAVADGGTGSSTAGGARTNLGLVIGTDVQAWDGILDDVVSGAGGASDGYVLTSDGAGGVAFEAAPGSPVVREQDGTPSVSVSEFRVPDGTLTDHGGGAVSLDYQKGHANLTALAGLTLASDQLLYANDVGTLSSGSLTTALDDLVDVSGSAERWLYRTGTTWQSVTPTADSVLGTNGSGAVTQHAAAARSHMARRSSGTVLFTGQLDLTSDVNVNGGFAELESTGHASTGSFQLNLDMTTTAGHAGGAQSVLAFKLDGATQNVHKIRADGAGGFDIFLRNISGTTSNHWFDHSANVWEFGTALRMLNISAPSTPAAGATVIYPKTGASLTWKGSSGTENSGVTPQTAPTSASTYGDSMVTGSGWADSTAETQFNNAVNRFNDFVTNGHNAQAITGGVNSHRTANLAAGTYV